MAVQVQRLSTVRRADGTIGSAIPAHDEDHSANSGQTSVVTECHAVGRDDRILAATARRTGRPQSLARGVARSDGGDDVVRQVVVSSDLLVLDRTDCRAIEVRRTTQSEDLRIQSRRGVRSQTAPQEKL